MQGASSRNEEWNMQMDAGPGKNLFADLVRSLKKSSLTPLPPRTKHVHFFNEDDLIEYEVTSQDMRNSWSTRNIPRTLENLDRMSYHRGLKVSYPKSVHQGKECIIRMEPTHVIDELLKLRGKHREAVLKEQASQVSSGKVDANALGKVAAANSERGVEIASSSWWLGRMNYRVY